MNLNYAIFRSEPVYTLNDLAQKDHIINVKRNLIILILILR